MRRPCCVILAISTLVLAAVGQPQPRAADAAARKAGDVVLEPATLTTPQTGTVKFEFGTLYVPENRTDPRSRLIGVGFARFKAAKDTGAPPSFHLPGGPGSSLLTSLRPDNKQLAGRLGQIEIYRRIGDVVLVDQRGFSERGDVLKYRHRKPEEPLDQPGSPARSSANFQDMARAAVAHFAGKGIDLRGYTVKECADDVNDLRQALGYERISLVGTSFGSQWSFAILRRHNEKVARALLSGVEPLDYGYDMPSHVFAAIQRLWWEAEKDPRLKPYLPLSGGLAEAARQVLRRLERAPVRVEVKDPRTGQMVAVTLGKEDFQRDAFHRGPAGPAFLLAAYHERYQDWAAAVLAARRSREIEQRMIGPLIDVSLGVTPRRLFLLRSDPAGEFLGHWNFKDSYLATAKIWPTADVGDDFRTERVCRTPVVFAQGDWDTSTPVENTLEVAPYYPNGRVLIAEHGGHGVLGPIAQNQPAVMANLLEFLEKGTTTDLPARVTLPVPRFALPSFPPPAAKE